MAAHYTHPQISKLVPDEARRLHFNERACVTGSAPSCGHASVMIEHGQGTRPDSPRRLKALERGCDLGDKECCEQAAVLLDMGDLAHLDPDKAKAEAFYARAESWRLLQFTQFQRLSKACENPPPRGKEGCMKAFEAISKTIEVSPEHESDEVRAEELNRMLGVSCRAVPRPACDAPVRDE